MQFDLTGKVVLVTGAASGIGRAGALALADSGARVVIGDLDERAGATAADIRARGGYAHFERIDVTDAADVARFVRGAAAEFGSVDVAWNNAGVLPPAGPLHEQSVDDWARTIAVDLTGVFYCMREEIAVMLSQGHGSIINTSSVAGLIGDPGMSPYVAAKHGVIGLTRAAAVDYGTHGIRVNAIAPGLVETPMTAGWLADPVQREQVVMRSLLGRAAQPHEIAGIVLYLASDLSMYATGGVFPVDGGLTAH